MSVSDNTVDLLESVMTGRFPDPLCVFEALVEFLDCTILASQPELLAAVNRITDPDLLRVRALISRRDIATRKLLAGLFGTTQERALAAALEWAELVRTEAIVSLSE